MWQDSVFQVKLLRAVIGRHSTAGQEPSVTKPEAPQSAKATRASNTLTEPTAFWAENQGGWRVRGKQ